MAGPIDFLKDKLREQIENVLKSNADLLPEQPEEPIDVKQEIGRKALIDDPFYEQMSQQVLFKHKLTRLSNKTLKDVSLRDWLISSIIQNRVDTLLRFSRPTHKRFEIGFNFSKVDKKDEVTDEDRQTIASLEDFIYNCGRTENVPQDDKMLFGEFIKMTCRDALTFGNIAIEKVKTRAGGLHRFRPLPAETLYLINKRATQEMIINEIKQAKQVYAANFEDGRQVNEAEISKYKYVQVSLDNRVLAGFGDEDLIFKLFNPQNFADMQGYCLSPLELCIVNITNHLNVEHYNANFFTHGYAARGLLHLKGTVTQTQLAAFRRQFYNTISGAQHAWRTPIIAGLDEVQWVPMSGSAKEMEYINFNNHLLRAICSQFQIDPVELGLDFLGASSNRSSGQVSNNEFKIEYSRERGLYPILMFFEDIVNSELLPAINKEYVGKYRFSFSGYTDETPQTEIAQLQAEMTVWKSMNDILTQVHKDKINEPGADLPMNMAFWSLVEKNYTRGEIREKFFGDVGAATRKELSYIPGDPAFMGWQQLLMTAQAQQEQMEQQQQMMQAQSQDQAQNEAQDKRHAEAKHQREEEKHKKEMHAQEMQGALNAAKHGSGSSIKDLAKDYGLGSKPLEIGGQSVANPINKSDDPQK